MISDIDETIIGLQQTGQLAIYCPITLDPEDLIHLRIVCGITDNLKGRLSFFSLIRNLITVILIILYYG